MKIKTKAWIYGIIVVLAVIGINLIILSILNFPPMALSIMKKYFILFILLFGGFGLQVGLFTYFKSLNAISCSTTIVSGGISGIGMTLCCSHYLLTFLPFLGSLIGLSGVVLLSKYLVYFLWLGIISNIIGISILIYKNKESKK